MRNNYSVVATGMLFIFVCPVIAAQSNSKGADSPIVVGTITALSADGAQITVKTSSATRELKLVNSKPIYVGMPEVKDRIITVGYGVKANVEKGDVVKSIILTLPLPADKPLGEERIKLETDKLFSRVDHDKNGKVDYVEFSISISRSEKHGPDTFRKCDSDNDGTLNSQEFSAILPHVDWWRLSRKDTAAWMAQTDKNKDNQLNEAEFMLISQSQSHNAEHFKRTDRDASGTVSQDEIAAYMRIIVDIQDLIVLHPATPLSYPR